MTYPGGAAVVAPFRPDPNLGGDTGGGGSSSSALCILMPLLIAYTAVGTKRVFVTPRPLAAILPKCPTPKASETALVQMIYRWDQRPIAAGCLALGVVRRMTAVGAQVKVVPSARLGIFQTTALPCDRERELDKQRDSGPGKRRWRIIS